MIIHPIELALCLMYLLSTASFQLRAPKMVPRILSSGKLSAWPFKGGNDEFEKLKFNRTMALEYDKMKMANDIERLKIQESTKIEHLKIQESMKIEHLKIDDMAKKNNIERFRILVFALLSGVFLFILHQTAIYIRDGFLSKKSGAMAVFAILSIAIGQLTQGMDSIGKFVHWIAAKVRFM